MNCSSVPPTRSDAAVPAPIGMTRATLELPDQFGPYRRIRTLGDGGMGVVHLAEDIERDRTVALKISRFGRHDPCPEGLERFRREALAATKFTHPGLCKVFDSGVIDGVYYLAMEYVAGDSLSWFLKDQGDGLTDDLAIQLVGDVAQAMVQAHAARVIHRDLKPSNIILRDGRPVVIDFGLAWWPVAGVTRLTKNGTVLGTPHYMSPEQVNGDVRLMGPGCDIYSLGVILYEMLTRRLPFEGSLASVLGKILFCEPEPPSSYRPDLDPRLEVICNKAMAKELTDRYATMADMALALASI